MAVEWEKLTPLPASTKALLQRVTELTYIPAPAQPLPSLSPAFSSDSSLVSTALPSLEALYAGLRRSYDSITDALDLIRDLEQYRSAIIAQGSSFTASCADLVQRRDYLIRLSSDLQAKFSYYTQLHSMQTDIELLQQNPTLARRRFMPLLSQLEDCLDFFRSNPHYVRSAAMLKEYSELKEEWLCFLEKHVIATFTQFYSQELDKIYKKIPDFDSIQVALTALRTKGDTEDLYFDVFLRIEQAYLQLRLRLLLPAVQSQVDRILTSEKDPVRLLRASCELLQRYLHKEQKLYSHYFGGEDALKGIKDPLSGVSQRLYESLRPKIIKEQSVDVLCELAEMLKTEFLRENFVFFTRVFQDIQERLMYRVQVYTSSEIYGYDGPMERPQPVLVRTITLLAKLYNRVDYGIFKGLAQEAVVACLSWLKQHMVASDFISAHVDLIASIVELRKEVEAMYEHVEMAVSSSELDFSNTKHLFWRIVTGEISLRAGPGLAEIVQLGAPKLTETSQDTKELIQEELRIACQSLILQLFHATSDPLIRLMVRVRNGYQISKEEAESGFLQAKKAISELLPVSCKRVKELKVTAKEQSEVIKAARLQILKAFQQLLSHVKKQYPEQNWPTILEIEAFVTESSELF